MKFALLFVLVAGSYALEYTNDFTVEGKSASTHYQASTYYNNNTFYSSLRDLSISQI